MFVDKLTSPERMLNLALRKGIDRVPVLPNATGYTGVLAGMSMKEFYLEPQNMLKAQLWAAEMHQYDTIPGFDIPSFAGWDFGGEMQFPPRGKIQFPVLTRHAVEQPSDVDKLELPDLDTAPAASRYLKFARLTHEAGFPVGIHLQAPLSNAVCVASTEKVLRWCYKEPELVHRILRITTDYTLALADRLIDEFGAENCCAFEPAAVESNAVIPPKLFEKFALPYIIEIHDKLIAKGVLPWLIHLCGDHTQNLRFWKEQVQVLPRTIFNLGSKVDLTYAAEVLGEDYIIGGNVPTTLLQNGTPDEVFEASRIIIEKMKHFGGGFALMPACAMPLAAPPVNVHALVRAARIFGSYE